MPLKLEPKNNSSIDITKDLASVFISDAEIANEAAQFSKNIFTRRKAIKQYRNKQLTMLDVSRMCNSRKIRKQYQHKFYQNNIQDKYLILLQTPSFTKNAHKKMQLDNIGTIIDVFPSKSILDGYLESISSIKEFYNVKSLHAKIIKLGQDVDIMLYPGPNAMFNISNAVITKLISNQDIVNELNTMSPYASIHELPLFSKFIQESNITYSSAEIILKICQSEKVYDLEEFVSCH